MHKSKKILFAAIATIIISCNSFDSTPPVNEVGGFAGATSTSGNGGTSNVGTGGATSNNDGGSRNIGGHIITGKGGTAGTGGKGNNGGTVNVVTGGNSDVGFGGAGNIGGQGGTSSMIGSGGSGGMNGSGGTGGMGGSGGISGTGGSGNTGGMAGSGNNGGMTGLGGTAGTNGTGGAGNTGGTSGAGGTTGGAAGNSGTTGSNGSTGNGGAPVGTGGAAGMAGTSGTGGTTSNIINNIMPLGDSITLGVNGGYRNGLWDRITTYGKKVNFVGSQYDQYTKISDKDHEGHPGFTITNIGTNIDSWLSLNKPDIVLLMIGTNDVAWWCAQTASEVADLNGMLIDKIFIDLPNSWIVVASIPPELSKIIQPNNIDRAELVKEYNKELLIRINNRIAMGKHIKYADVNSVLFVSDLYDGIHPTELAHDKIAQVWFDAVVSLLQ